MQEVFISVKEYEKQAVRLHDKIQTANKKRDWVALQKYMSEAEELKKRFAQQRFSIEEATPNEEDRTNLLHSVVKLTVLADIMNGAMIEMKERMGKAGILHSDAYDTCEAIIFNTNRLVKAMDELGDSTSLALEALTEHVESQYMFGMDNTINRLLRHEIEIKPAI